MAQARRVTIDEKFNAEYAKKGLQPSVSKDGRIRNVRVQNRQSDTVFDTETGGELSNQPRPASQPYQAPIATQVRTQAYRPQRPPQKNIAIKNKSGKSDLKTRAKASAVNSSILAWAMPLYFAFQIPIAIINLVFFGLGYVYLSIFGLSGELDPAEDDMLNEETGLLETVSGWFWEGVGVMLEAVNVAIETITGFDLGEFINNVFNPMNVYMATMSLLMAYMMFLLLTIGLLYIFAGFRPLSGKGAVSKIVAVIMCFIGYFTPFLNLFPWFLLWTTAVWKNPK